MELCIQDIPDDVLTKLLLLIPEIDVIKLLVSCGFTLD